MSVLSAVGIAVVAAVLCAMLRRYHAEYAVLTAVAAGILIMLQVLSAVIPVLDELTTLFASVESQHLSVVLKALGICLLTQFAADTCTDAGEKALASRVEFAGRLAVVALALPLFSEIVQAILSLTGAAE